MGDILSQDDLNSLFGGSLCNEKVAPRKEETIISADLEGLLSQDDLNSHLGGLSENQKTALREEPKVVDVPATGESGSMSQDEIDELLRQFDRDI